MPTKNLSKIQKKIAKKKGGRSTCLHENSRDVQRLRRAGARSERLDKLAAARAKAHGPLCTFPLVSRTYVRVGFRVLEDRD